MRFHINVATLHITLGTILGIINEEKRIAGKNNWKF